MLGTPKPVMTPGNPKAHLTFSFGVVWLVKPAAAAGWKRVLPASAQPFQLPVVRCGVPVHCALATRAVKTKSKMHRAISRMVSPLLADLDQPDDVERAFCNHNVPIASRHHVAHNTSPG